MPERFFGEEVLENWEVGEGGKMGWEQSCFF
jgi:hypothetical protein